MKKNLHLIAFFVCLFNLGRAQGTYPYNQDFENYSAFSAPNDWVNTIPGIQVYLGRGFNGSKGLSKNLNQFTLKDSTASPLIGPLTANSVLTFDYRQVDYIGNIGVKHYMDPGDAIVVSVVNGTSTTPVYRIDKNNHTDTSAFKKDSVALGNFAGSTVRIRFSLFRGGTTFDFNFDIDNVSVKDISGTTTQSLSLMEIPVRLYPNPAKSRAILQFELAKPEKIGIQVMDMSGRNLVQVNQKSYLAGSQSEELNLEGLSQGVYWVTIQGEQSQLTRKLVIE